MRKQEKNVSKIKSVLQEHVKNNLKEYIIVSLIFLIGIIIGIVFVNNSSDEQRSQIQEHLGTFTQSLNTDYKIDQVKLLRSSIVSNLLLALTLWLMGSTIIGIPIVFIVIGIRGFSLGYTISSIMITYPMFKAITFTICTLLLQNIIFIPCILALSVSGIKLYKAIVKDKRRENIKVEILKHTIFSGLATILLILASFVEVYLSSNLLTLTINMFA